MALCVCVRDKRHRFDSARSRLLLCFCWQLQRPLAFTFHCCWRCRLLLYPNNLTFIISSFSAFRWGYTVLLVARLFLNVRLKIGERKQAHNNTCGTKMCMCMSPFACTPKLCAIWASAMRDTRESKFFHRLCDQITLAVRIVN